MYESESRDISLATTGDCTQIKRLSVYKEKRFLGLIELLHSVDVAFTNLEMPIRRDEGHPTDKAVKLCARPEILDDLKWAGFDLFNCANNHATDFAEGGLIATIKYLDERGMVHAGIGNNLAEARKPGYLEVSRGRVALIGVDLTGVATRAGEQRPDMKGRPGVNSLLEEVSYTVDEQTFNELRRLKSLMNSSVTSDPPLVDPRTGGFWGVLLTRDTDTELNFMGTRYILGEAFARHSTPNKADLDGNLEWISEARRQADWVILSPHLHGLVYPGFARIFFHAAIDAGVDVVTNGDHRVRGIEIYQGKPIFWGLGNFAFELEAVDPLDAGQYSSSGLGHDATPADVWEARFKKGTTGFVIDRDWWEGLCAITRFKGGSLSEIRLYPLDLGYQRPRPRRGRAMLAEGELAESILRRVSERSAKFGTEIVVKNGVGVITL